MLGFFSSMSNVASKASRLLNATIMMGVIVAYSTDESPSNMEYSAVLTLLLFEEFFPKTNNDLLLGLHATRLAQAYYTLNTDMCGIPAALNTMDIANQLSAMFTRAKHSIENRIEDYSEPQAQALH